MPRRGILLRDARQDFSRKEEHAQKQTSLVEQTLTFEQKRNEPGILSMTLNALFYSIN